ncbi:MAG: 4-alpha-glucanotransferase [Myxococcaceae bacterium]
MSSIGRVSGVLLPLFSLRSRTDFGIGDFGALEGFFQWLATAKQKLWMTLPLLPTAPGDSSPYATRSAFGLNPLFIDLAQVPELAELGGITSLSSEDRAKLEEARAAKRIRYDLVFALKSAALRRAFEHFESQHWRTQSARAQELKRYLEEQKSWLESFVLFTAISRDRNYQGWWDWPQGLKEREPKALDAERERLAREVLFESWTQWITETQWRTVRERAKRNGVLLCGDEPFIIGQDSSDTWANPSILRRDARLGVPPDAFSAAGQDWGLPYFDLAAMGKDNHAWIRLRAHKAASYYDLRRVDHAVGYFRQWIRDAQTPTGRFIPPDEESHRRLGEQMFQILGSEAAVIAEDLGVIPPFVRETLTRLNIPGYRVLRWERDDHIFRNPHHFPKMSLATTGTHDTETLREWWEQQPHHEREAVARVYPELQPLQPVPGEFTPVVHEALLASAENAASDVCVIPWQDALGTRDRVNLPGSMNDANWSYRIEQNAEDLNRDPDAQRAAALLARLTTQAGR